MNSVSNRFGGCRGRRNGLESLSRQPDHHRGARPVSAATFRRLQVLNEAIDIQAGVRRHHILRLGENIFNEGREDNAEGNFAVNTAEGQVVNLVAERRNVRPLAGVDIHDKYILSVEIDVRSEVKEKGVYPPLYSPRRVPLIHTVDAVMTPSKSTKT